MNALPGMDRYQKEVVIYIVNWRINKSLLPHNLHSGAKQCFFVLLFSLTPFSVQLDINNKMILLNFFQANYQSQLSDGPVRLSNGQTEVPFINRKL